MPERLCLSSSHLHKPFGLLCACALSRLLNTELQRFIIQFPTHASSFKPFLLYPPEWGKGMAAASSLGLHDNPWLWAGLRWRSLYTYPPPANRGPGRPEETGAPHPLYPLSLQSLCHPQGLTSGLRSCARSWPKALTAVPGSSPSKRASGSPYLPLIGLGPRPAQGPGAPASGS